MYILRHLNCMRWNYENNLNIEDNLMDKASKMTGIKKKPHSLSLGLRLLLPEKVARGCKARWDSKAVGSDTEKKRSIIRNGSWDTSFGFHIWGMEMLILKPAQWWKGTMPPIDCRRTGLRESQRQSKHPSFLHCCRWASKPNITKYCHL